jgi:hypothetical protein
MGLDGAFGHVQIAGNFGVVTSLEKQIDDLLLPASQPVDLLIHSLHLAETQGMPPVFWRQQGTLRSGLGVRLPFLVQPHSQICRFLLTKCEYSEGAVFIRGKLGSAGLSGMRYPHALV